MGSRTIGGQGHPWPLGVSHPYSQVVPNEERKGASGGTFARLLPAEPLAIVGLMTKGLLCGRRATPNRLWKYRRRIGFTQHQVAALVGYVSRTDISHFEAGRKLPSLLMALRLEIVYRVPVAFLYPDLYGRLKAALRAKEERLRAKWDGHEAQTSAKR